MKLDALNFHRRPWLLSILLLSPSIVLLVGLVFRPLISNFILAFRDMNLLNPDRGSPFIGLENFSYLLTDFDFLEAIWNTIQYTAGTVFLEVVVGFIIALLLNFKFPFRGFVRTIMIIPWAIPTVVGAFIFVLLFNDAYGVVNYFLNGVGIIDENVIWLGQPRSAMFIAIIGSTWKGLPFCVLVFMAGLQIIPREIVEAARVDGATAFREFLHITLPYMRNVIAIVVVLRTIWTFNWFEFLWILTRGGPGTSTVTLPLYAFISAFESYQMSEAAAVSVIMFLILITFVIIFFFVSPPEEEEK